MGCAMGSIMAPTHVGVSDGLQLWREELLLSFSTITTSAVICTGVPAIKKGVSS